MRNLIELAGEGDEDYPAMEQWEEPKALIARATSLMEKGQFEALVPILAMAELATAQAADRVWAYENRVESGARFWVKWLGRVKTVGSVAASIAAGPLGITGSALVAGGYTFVQEGAQNATAYALGQRTDLGIKSLVKQAGIATSPACSAAPCRPGSRAPWPRGWRRSPEPPVGQLGRRRSPQRRR